MADKPTVFEAWSKVMGEVQSVGKNQTNTTPGQNYKFRGVDAVMNAVGPVLRKHGVFVVPEDVDQTHRDVLTTKGNPSREATVMVRYRVYGPAGDSFPMCAPGESMDSGDKGTPKAMSVAYRTVLLQALTIPTDDPEPDATTYERAPESQRQNRAERPFETGEAMNAKTRGRMFALLTELKITDEVDQRAGMANVLGHPVASRADLTEAEAQQVIRELEKLPKPKPEPASAGPNIPTGA